MKIKKLPSLLVFLFLTATFLILQCSKDVNDDQASDIWDIEKDGIPQFVNVNYIDLESIAQISKFRSSIGHDYSDAFEQCRSMKHYFMPGVADWSTVKIYSPVTGIITRVEQEWAGTKIEIQSEEHPAFRFVIFHINLNFTPEIGQTLSEGTQLGTHWGNETYSDIAVIVNDPTRQGRMVSYFDVMMDAVFNQYIQRGISSRESLIISKTERDASPLTCDNGTFKSSDNLEGWTQLYY